jgi:hypothetical protein
MFKGWRTLAWNLLLVIAPPALTYLAHVDWPQYLNPTWTAMAMGVIGIGLRLVTTSTVGKK